MREGRAERRTTDGQSVGVSAGGSGWTTTDVAAKGLGVSPRSVRRFIDRGDLQGRKVKNGIVETWEVSIDSLQVLRDRRGPEGRVRREVRGESVEKAPAADPLPDMADLVRDLTIDLVRASSEATEFRVRLEITERAESTLREELVQERERREQAERRVAELEQRLGPSEDTPQTPQSVPEASDSPSPHPDTVRAQEGAEVENRAEHVGAQTDMQRHGKQSWWRRIFGG